jgi:hypothetical protein
MKRLGPARDRAGQTKNDAHGLGLPGLLIDTHFKADSLALADFIAVSQC